MSYRLKFDEPVHKGWRRIVGEQIETALTLLRSKTDVDAAVHETRKAMKRVRALLKLLRPGLSAADYRREKKRFADVGRLISGVRDRAVLAATAAALSEQTMGKARVAAQRLARHASSHATAATRASGQGEAPGEGEKAVRLDDGGREEADRVKAAIVALEQAGKSVKKLKLRSHGFDVVRTGLAKTYRAARRYMKLAYKTNVDEHFHEWRKSVQAHWRHMLLVDRAWPDVFAARAQLAKEMSDLLGEDHDLYVLVRTLDTHQEWGSSAAGRDALVRAARVRQDAIRAELEAKGKALFAEPANRFIARIDSYWTAARTARKVGGRSGGKSKAQANVVLQGVDGLQGAAALRGSQSAKPKSAKRSAVVPAQAKPKRSGGNGAGAAAAKASSRSQVSAAVSRRGAKRSAAKGTAVDKLAVVGKGKPPQRARNGSSISSVRKDSGKA